MKTAKLVELVKAIPPDVRRSLSAALVETEIQLLRQHAGAATTTDRRFFDGQANCLRSLAEMISPDSSKNFIGEPVVRM